MDNLTHTLVGLLVGETAAKVAPTIGSGLPIARKRTAMLTMMVAGGNLPDLDFLYSMLTGSKLDYLLHHRGHTHTVVGALIATALMLIACAAWLRRRQLRASVTDRWQLLIVALLAPLLHIAMDYTNSYGVHPFWPLDNGWRYGDSIFIVEPLLWSVAAPLICILRTRTARWAVALAVATGLLLSFVTGMVPLPFAIPLLILVAVLLALGRFAPPRTALLAGIGSWLVATAVFTGASRVATTRVSQLAAAQFPEMTTLDHVLTPMPVNPVCWEVMLVQADERDLVIRRAMMSLAPQFMRADRCPSRGLAMKTTAPLQAVQRADTAAVHWAGEIVTPQHTLRELVASHCEAAALMRFARAPWAARSTATAPESALANADADPRHNGQRDEQPGERHHSEHYWMIGDLRYDREPSLGFAELALVPQLSRCPQHVPPWSPPRGDIIGGAPWR